MKERNMTDPVTAAGSDGQQERETPVRKPPCDHNSWDRVGLYERVCLTCARAIGPERSS